MGYTRAQILEQCQNAFENKNTFYQMDFVNYTGQTTDTREYYTEVVAEFLCDNITDYINGIDCITRKSTYKTKGHDGKINPASNREEENIAKQFFNQSRDFGPFPLIGKIEDYQTPLKSSADDKAGKIDLLSFDGKIMRILELKKPDSKETMLRCVLEGFTYLQTVDKPKLIFNFKDELTKDFVYNPEEVEVKASPFVFYGGAQHKEMAEPRPHLHKLMTLLDSKPYYIKEAEPYDVVEE